MIHPEHSRQFMDNKLVQAAAIAEVVGFIALGLVAGSNRSDAAQPPLSEPIPQYVPAAYDQAEATPISTVVVDFRIEE